MTIRGVTVLALALTGAPFGAIVAQASGDTPSPRHFVYGSNPTAGSYFEHHGVKLYYEIYGKGPPLLMIHGNGASIWSLKPQIEFFRRHYRVIVMDSRDHGRSADAPGPLTFEAMSDDLAALLDHVRADPALVLGWSDGAIEALLLGIRHPDKVVKIAAMAANLNPQGLVPEVLAQEHRAPIADPAHTPSRAERVAALDRDEPHIRPDELLAIKAPTLVLAGDHDLITDVHTLEIFHHIPNGELAIFPNATHMIPADDPKLFNETVDRFFRTPFVKIDRFQDVIKSLQRLKAESVAEHRLVGK